MYTWSAWQFPPEKEGPVLFYSEPEARAWLHDSITGQHWPSKKSQIYIVELDHVTSAEIMLSGDVQEKFQDLVTENLIEELWTQQYGRSLNVSS